MSTRIDRSWVVVSSIETPEGDRCVDLFSRPDGTWGFEAFRRNVEDRGEWTAVRYRSGVSYGSFDAALLAAEEAVMWLAERLGDPSPLRRPVPPAGRSETGA